jgi:hypothetical protein
VNDTLPSLSKRSIALRVLPAVVALTMLVIGPPSAPPQAGPSHGSGAQKSTR